MEKHVLESPGVLVRSRRGRKPKNKAVLDFSVADAIKEYEPLLTKFQSTNDSDMAPHEAAAEAMKETRKELGNISTKRLLNLMSEFRHCEVSESDEIPPDDHDPPIIFRISRA
jgi:hypothetical protein